jgi:hypothetical protein
MRLEMRVDPMPQRFAELRDRIAKITKVLV